MLRRRAVDMTTTSLDEAGRLGDAADGDAPAGPDRVTAPRRRRPYRRVVLAALLLLVATLTTDLALNRDLGQTRRSLTATTAQLRQATSALSHTLQSVNAESAVQVDRVQAIDHTAAAILNAHQQLAASAQADGLQTVDIATLNSCLGGVSTATTALGDKDLAAAVHAINAAGPFCQLLAGGSSGASYPFDFPDPDIILVGDTYYAFATNSAAGNIQIIESNDHEYWTTVGDALPHLPAWAAPGATWAPDVLPVGSSFVMYYSADFGTTGEQCISEAVATRPQGPYVDTSTAPLVCQLGLGGSMDPSAVVDQNGIPSLVWKSQGAGGQPPTLWAQQLTQSGTTLAPGTTPTALLQPDQSWQHGVVEGPDMVLDNGQYILFYSGSDWTTDTYAIGYARCAGPLGPCTDQSPAPLLASGPDFSGPGGETVFADPQGRLWIGFHAWIPGEVGYPHSRELFVRSLDLSGPVPQIGS